MKIKSFYISGEDINLYLNGEELSNKNIFGDTCLVYSLNIQAFPGTKFQIGDNENSFVLIGNSGCLKLECEKYPISCMRLHKDYYVETEAGESHEFYPPNINIYPIIIDIVYKGEITNV